jgi:hypothetical protein
MLEMPRGGKISLNCLPTEESHHFTQSPVCSCMPLIASK